jgi:hypothetical protein
MSTIEKTEAVAELHFDWHNPRLVEFGISDSTKEEEILKILWDSMDVMELVLSISSSGYFPHEPLIVTEENGKKVVLEGNRRLAALKILTVPTLTEQYSSRIPHIPDEMRSRLQNVPVIYQDRRESWKYLGFKHVNGPAKWTGFAKAKYIADVHNKYDVPLEQIAKQIGDGHNTVQRLYRGLMVLEQASTMGVYHTDDRYSQRIFFSHLYTSLQYPGFSSFLGLSADSEDSTSPVPETKRSELREVCVWLFGSKKEEKPPVIRRQNPDLKRLDEVLQNVEALAALRSGEDLNKAFELSRPYAEVLEDSLLAAKRELMKARGYVITGYNGSDALLRTAGQVANLADSIYSELFTKSQEPKSRRIV